MKSDEAIVPVAGGNSIEDTKLYLLANKELAEIITGLECIWLTITLAEVL